MKLSRKTLLAGLPIVGLWLAATALLVDRQRMPRLETTFDSSPRLEQATDSWMTLHAGRQEDARRIGYVHLQQIPEARNGADGVRVELAVHMTLQMFGRVTGLDLGGFAWRPWVGKDAQFDFRVRSGESDFRIAGEIHQGRLTGVVHSAGEAIPLELSVRDNALFGSGFGSALTFPQLEIGDEIRIDTFDPMTLRAGTARVRCIAEQQLEVAGESLSTRVLKVTSGGLETRAWVDDRGEVVRAETALGLTVMRSSAEEALAPIEGGDNVGEFLSLTSIQPTGQRPFRGAVEMIFAVGGDLPEGDPPQGGLPLDATQTAGPGERQYRTSSRPGETDAEPESLAAYLGADAFVQSDHWTIVAQAHSILDGVRDDPASRARALHDWVYQELDKVAVLSIPSAIEVLEQRRGDCNEHAVLYTALARAAGLPTRIAIGVVWSEQLSGFYYHAWPEVWLEQRWRWIDPTLGQPVADATHVKLLNGGIESWPQLLPYLGRLEIDVLEIR